MAVEVGHGLVEVVIGMHIGKGDRAWGGYGRGGAARLPGVGGSVSYRGIGGSASDRGVGRSVGRHIRGSVGGGAGGSGGGDGGAAADHVQEGGADGTPALEP